jgi:hypothetical protein
MEQDRSYIYEPGVETPRFRYRNHHPDGSPVVMKSVSLEAVFSILVGIPPTGEVCNRESLKP